MNVTRLFIKKLLQNTSLSALRTTSCIRLASQTSTNDGTTQEDTTHFGFQTIRSEEKQEKGKLS